MRNRYSQYRTTPDFCQAYAKQRRSSCDHAHWVQLLHKRLSKTLDGLDFRSGGLGGQRESFQDVTQLEIGTASCAQLKACIAVVIEKAAVPILLQPGTDTECASGCVKMDGGFRVDFP